MLHVRYKALPRLLAVIADIDPRRYLPSNYLRRGLLNRSIKFAGVNDLGAASSTMEIGQLVGPWETPGMGGHDPGFARQHLSSDGEGVDGLVVVTNEQPTVEAAELHPNGAFEAVLRGVGARGHRHGPA